MNNLTYSEYIANSFRKFWDIPSMTDYPISSFKYSEVAYKIRQIWFAFTRINIKNGDKIAICGSNSVNWAVTYLATTTYGTVAVPILHEFTGEKIRHLISHSDSVMLFVSDTIWNEIVNETSGLNNINCVYSLDDFKILFSNNEKEPYEIGSITLEGCTSDEFADSIYYYSPDELIAINYTSGTMSSPKGVMIPSRALSSNLSFALEVVHMLKTGDNVVSLLPLAHMYGIMYDFLGAIVFGVNVHFLTRPMTPKNLLNTFKYIKPCIIIAVPLIIEKIIRERIFKYTHKSYFKLLYGLLKPLVDKFIGWVLKRALGGNFYEIIIGGATLDGEIEQALIDFNIPFTVGYGMTECSPIIAYSDKNDHKFRSCGKAAPRMKIEIRNGNQIYVKGENVMLGYYKGSDTTSNVLKDGWFNTGDIGYFDSDGNLYIEGRKDLIINSDGKNINPLEIEEILKCDKLVNGAVVFYDKKNKKLKAHIYPTLSDFDANELKKRINKKLSPNEQIAEFVVCDRPFEKTPKMEIKRYLYIK